MKYLKNNIKHYKYCICILFNYYIKYYKKLVTLSRYHMEGGNHLMMLLLPAQQFFVLLKLHFLSPLL